MTALSGLMAGATVGSFASHCLSHGGYVSRQLFGNVFSRCPQCAAEEAEKNRQLDASRDAEIRRARWQATLGRAAIPLRFTDRSFDNYVVSNPGQRQALAFAREFAADFAGEGWRTGRSALFLGRPGTGKNHLAAAICIEALMRGHSVLHSTVLKALRRIKDTWARGAQESESAAIHAHVFPDLLVLDEVGVQFGSAAEQLLLTDIINERYEQRKPTLLLSNLPLAEIKTYLGERVYDRLREDGGRVVVFDWDSHRGKQGVAA